MRRVVPHSPPNVRAVTVTRPLWLGVLAALYSTAAQGVNLFTTILLQCKYFYDTLNLYQGTFTLQTCPFIKYIKLSVLHYLAFASGTCTNTAHKPALFIYFFFVICRFSAPMIMKCRPHIYTWSTLLLSDKKKKKSESKKQSQATPFYSLKASYSCICHGNPTVYSQTQQKQKAVNDFLLLELNAHWGCHQFRKPLNNLQNSIAGGVGWVLFFFFRMVVSA